MTTRHHRIPVLAALPCTHLVGTARAAAAPAPGSVVARREDLGR